MLASLTIVLTGCATKQVATVVLDPYTPPPAPFKKCGVIYVSGIADHRPDKTRIGDILQKGKVVTKIRTTQNLTHWFKEALEKAMRNEGCRITPQSTHHPKIARVYLRIDRIEGVLDRDKLTGENLTASVYVTLFMRQGKSERIIKKIGLTQKKWVPPLSGESAVKAYLQKTMNEVVNMIVEHIDTYRF